MAKLNKWDKANMRNIAAIERQIDEIFNTAAREAAALGSLINSVNPDRLFSFDDYPQTKDRLNKLLQGLNRKLQASIVNGIRSGWTLSNNKNNELSRQVFGNNIGKLSQQAYRRYFSTNDDAQKAFVERKTNGLKLSDRVWNYTTGFKNEIELGLDVSIRNGMSAADMTKELRKYLKYPDKLFRRVRDEHGNLQLSKAAAAFHPGQGVYRSSYKNARRLAATETNMAYRTSDHLRWQQADYVVGIRVVLSNNHTLLGQDGKPHKFTDICDELSAPLNFTPEEKRGLYPKDFKFVGWHPHCRCHALSVLKTPEEMKEDTKRILAGEETTSESVNRVTDVPQEFKGWIADNEKRLTTAKSMPYFVRDNEKYFPQMRITDAAAKGVKEAQVFSEKIATLSTPKPLTINERAAIRHAARTAEQAQAIQKAWDVRRINALDDQWMDKGINRKNAGFDLLNDARAALLDKYDHTKVKKLIDESAHKIKVLQDALARQAARTADEIRKIQDLADTRKYGKAYVDTIHEMENKLGMKRGKRMTHSEANEGKVNPKYGKRGYNINCSTCTATYYMRRLGFDVTAKASIKANEHVRELSRGYTTWEKWKGGRTRYHSTKAWMNANNLTNMNTDAYRKFINAFTKEDGFYEFNVGYESGGGHSTILLREKGVIYRIEQQIKKVKKQPLEPLLANLKKNPNEVRGIYRIDNAEFNELYADIFEKPKKKKK